MKIATAQLHSISPYSQSRYHDTPKLDKELPVDYEKRTWRERLHVDDDGVVFIPPMAFKNCLAEAALYLSIKIPGKNRATYTKHFEAGVLVMDGLDLGVAKDDVEGEMLFLSATGKRGTGTRVQKWYPVIRDWSGEIAFHVLDEIITKDVFRNVLAQAGQFIGIGRFRPRNNGYYGRFSVDALEWSDAA